MGNRKDIESFVIGEVENGSLAADDAERFLSAFGNAVAKDGEIVVGGKRYPIVGTPERMPAGVFRPARKIAKKAAAIGDDQARLNAFYRDNMDAILDVSESIIIYALGDVQFAEAEDALNKMDMVEYCAFGLAVMSKYQNVKV